MKQLNGCKLKAFVLLACYILGEEVPPKFKNDTNYVIRITPQII